MVAQLEQFLANKQIPELMVSYRLSTKQTDYMKTNLFYIEF